MTAKSSLPPRPTQYMHDLNEAEARLQALAESPSKALGAQKLDTAGPRNTTTLYTASCRDTG